MPTSFVQFQKILKNRWKSFLLFLAAGFLLYFKSIFYEHTYLDDNKFLIDNLYILKDFSSMGKIFSEDVFLSPLSEAVPYYRPLLVLSFFLDIQIAGEHAAFFAHVMNIVYHAIAVLLLFMLLQKFSGSIHLSFVLSVIFLVHPVLTQSVAWLPGRGDALLGIFVFAAVIELINFMESGRWRHFIFHSLLFLCALLSKESAIMLPFVCLILLLQKRPYDSKRYTYFISAWLIIGISWGVLRNAVLANAQHNYFENFFSNILFNLPVIIQYTGKILLPFKLSVLPTIQDTPMIWGIAATLVIIAIAFLARNKIQNRATVIFGISWFILFLVPALIIRNLNLTHDFQFEHRLYVPLAGFLIFIPPLIRVNEEESSLQLFYSYSGLLTGILAVITFIHENNFKDRYSFWMNAVNTAPSTATSHLNLATVYSVQKQYQLALNELNTALTIRPQDGAIHREFGAVYLKMNRLEDAAFFLRTSLSFDSASYIGYSNLAVVYLNREQYDTALAYLLKALQLKPNHVNTLGNLGFCYIKTQQYELAESVWKKALEIDPKHFQTHQNLTFFYAERRRYQEAFQHAQIFIELGGKLDAKFMSEIQQNLH